MKEPWKTVIRKGYPNINEKEEARFGRKYRVQGAAAAGVEYSLPATLSALDPLVPFSSASFFALLPMLLSLDQCSGHFLRFYEHDG